MQLHVCVGVYGCVGGRGKGGREEGVNNKNTLHEQDLLPDWSGNQTKYTLSPTHISLPTYSSCGLETYYHLHPPDCETNSRSFPSILISSLVPVGVHVTPCLIRTVLVYFSPRKFLISTTEFPSLILMLMGKWAYTARILYWNPWGKIIKACRSELHTVLMAG